MYRFLEISVLVVCFFKAAMHDNFLNVLCGTKKGSPMTMQ